MKFIGSGVSLGFIMDKINQALTEGYNLVIIEKVQPEKANPVYNIYATKAVLEAGQIKEK